MLKSSHMTVHMRIINHEASCVLKTERVRMRYELYDQNVPTHAHADADATCTCSMRVLDYVVVYKPSHVTACDNEWVTVNAL